MIDAKTAREALAMAFRSQADWRSQKAEEHPDDDRNLQAAEALGRAKEPYRRDFTTLATWAAEVERRQRAGIRLVKPEGKEDRP